jgi:hypothetical protein
VAAMTMDGRKLPLFMIIQRRTVGREWGLELDADGADASAHNTTRWMTVETVLLWLHFITSLPEYADGHGIHLSPDCYAVHRYGAAKELAERCDSSPMYSIGSDGHHAAAGPQCRRR